MIRLLALAAVATGLFGAPPASAQQAVPPPAVQPALPAQDFTDDELRTFAVAVIEVSRINDTYLPIYYAARTPEEQQLVEQKATEEMKQAVRNRGMSVDKYQEILVHAKTNPQIANRVDQLIQEAATGSSAVGR